MALRARNTSSGFSLIEMMLAMVIIMISMLALLTAVITTQRTNQENDLRNVAVRLTNQTAETLLALPLTDLELTTTLTGTTNTRVAAAHARTSGNAAQNGKGFPDTLQTVRKARVTYSIQWDVKEQTSNVREVTVSVSYPFRNQTRTNTSLIYKHRTL